MSQTKFSPAKPIPNGIRAGKIRFQYRAAAGPGPAPFPVGEFPELFLTFQSWDSIQAPRKRSRSRDGSSCRAWIGDWSPSPWKDAGAGIGAQKPTQRPQSLGNKIPTNQSGFGKFSKLPPATFVDLVFREERIFRDFPQGRSLRPLLWLNMELLDFDFLLNQLLFNRSPH